MIQQPYSPQFGYQPYTPQYPMQYTMPQPQVQAPQPIAKPAGIAGRVVANTNDISVQDVPTDGTVAWFPMQDGSAVIGKYWTPDGNITTMRFVPEAQPEREVRSDPFDAINGRIDDLAAIIEDLNDNIQRQYDSKRQTAQKRRMVKADATE